MKKLIRFLWLYINPPIKSAARGEQCDCACATVTQSHEMAKLQKDLIRRALWLAYRGRAAGREGKG